MEKNIVIIAAMKDVELDYLIKRLENSKKVEYNSFTFYQGKMFGRSVVLCESNIGLINASVMTTIAIEKFNPSVIINEGIAGGYTNDLHVGDIVTCIDAINITSLEYVGIGETLEDYEITTFIHGDNNRLIRQNSDEKMVELIRNNIKGIKFRNYWKRRYME